MTIRQATAPIPTMLLALALGCGTAPSRGPGDGTPDPCGDGVCAADETCSTCPADCGACPIVVGPDCIPAGATMSGRVFQVGPARTYTTIDAVQGQLGPGDRVEVDGDATYPPLVLRAFGSATSPIFFVGVLVNGRRPVLSGGTNTLHFYSSHHVIFQNFEITGGAERCVYHQADDVTLCQSVVRDCPHHGILGADQGSGSLLLDRIEVLHAGAPQTTTTNLKHPVYVATDPAAYPSAVFRIQNSFLHDNNAGDVIKSRALRTDVLYNWIESNGSMYYAVELDGFEVGVQPRPRQDADVVGNVFVHTSAFGVRFGGDDPAKTTRGRVRFDQNTVLLASAGWTITQPYIRFFGEMDAFEASNNVFYAIGGGHIRLVRDDATWVGGSEKIAGSRNWIPTGSTYVPAGLTGTVLGAGDPGFTSDSSVAGLDLTVTAGAEIRNAGDPLVSGPSGFEITSPVLVPTIEPPATRPLSASSMVCTARPAEANPTLGAHAAR